MIDPVQLVLLIVIIVLTLLLVILGIQVFFILRELRHTIEKTNKVIESANSITRDIEGPLAAVSSLVIGAKATSLFTVAKFLKNFLSKDDTEQRRHHRE